jgi:LysR family transcriptional regulator, glycine cleavage system transcriptional activator
MQAWTTTARVASLQMAHSITLPLVRLGYLDLLRGFVAVGRRMSITLAAHDLCLTPSAVSRQVAALEEALGCKLLVRGYRSISFTHEGQQLFRAADDAIAQLQEALGLMTSEGGRRPVTVTASVGVAALWLLPRLGRLQQLHPSIDARIVTTNRVLDLQAEQIDLAIRYCPAQSAPAGAQCLFEEDVVAVAAPSLALRDRALPALVASNVLLEYDDAGRPWLQWQTALARHGLTSQAARGVLRFNQYDQVIQACVSGQGIALGRLALIEPMLADGRLVTVASLIANSDHAYWLLQASSEPQGDVASVARWIVEEAHAQAAARESQATTVN